MREKDGTNERGKERANQQMSERKKIEGSGGKLPVWLIFWIWKVNHWFSGIVFWSGIYGPGRLPVLAFLYGISYTQKRLSQWGVEIIGNTAVGQQTNLPGKTPHSTQQWQAMHSLTWAKAGVFDKAWKPLGKKREKNKTCC